MERDRAKAAQNDGVRLADLLIAVSVGLDFATGMPQEWMVRSAYVAARLAEAAGLPMAERRATFDLALVCSIGCTTTALDDGRMFGDELAVAELEWIDRADPRIMMPAMMRVIGHGRSRVVRAVMVARLIAALGSGWMNRTLEIHCEAAERLAEPLGVSAIARDGLWHLYERWDGKGAPNGLAGEAIARPMRVVQIARIAAHYGREIGVAAAREAVAARAGRDFDPALVKTFLSGADAILEGVAEPDIRERVLAAEPGEPITLGDDALDRPLAAIADFADFKSPHMMGHSRRVAALSAAAASASGRPAADVALLRRAGYVHDIGRVGVPAAIWSKAGPLTALERERVRLHPYITGRVFADSPGLRAIGALGAMHHERLDATGYHRGLAASALGAEARLIATANAYCALTETRPHRQKLSQNEAAASLQQGARDGHFDSRAVEATLAATSSAPLRRRASSDLSEREVEVLRLVARQCRNREIAQTLGISLKTVERHVSNIYDKIGAQTRAGAALYAADKGLL